ncbi:MAG: hypothetical protein M1826_005356 [Phylliscum demangeonii]|nr:MAG: hypothetical protein M1826_005356 [Phylliscum demangeonii]
MANNSEISEMSRAKVLRKFMDPSKASLLDYNPYDILGVDPHQSDYFTHDTLFQACKRASKHTHPFATSSRLNLPPCVQAGLAFQTLCGPYREPAHAFWRVHHRSTWNPYAAVGSNEAGVPIAGQQEGADSPEEADLLMAAAIAAVESNADIYGTVLLGPYYLPRCQPGDGSGPGPTDYHLFISEDESGHSPEVARLLLGEHGGDHDGDNHLPTLPAVSLGSYRRSLETNERANAVVAMLDHRGRYYRRVVPWTMAGDPLLLDDDDLDIARSCLPAFIDYLPRFRDRAEVQVMAVVREELALLQVQIDAAARRQQPV